MSNPKGASWYSGGGIAHDMLPGAGQVFYLYGIDGGIGDNANNGLTPEAPFLTLTYALAQCTAEGQDYIVVLDYWQPTGEVWPIVVDVNAVHIIGSFGAGLQYAQFTPPGDTAVLSIAADRVSVSRLAFTAGATHGCIENAAAGVRWGTLYEDCWFGVLGAAQDGIRNVAAGDEPYMTVKRCRFGRLLTRDGIRIEHNMSRGMIGTPWGDGNVFEGIPGIGVNFAGSVAEVGIYNNLFAIPANTAGAAITLSAGSENNIVFGNRANFGDTDMGNNPYLDSAGAGSNHWGDNYQGITLVQPA